MKLYTYTFELPVTLPTGLLLYHGERWHVKLWWLTWKRDRGDWPADWRRQSARGVESGNPPWPGPIFRYWRLGPFDIWRFRERA